MTLRWIFATKWNLYLCVPFGKLWGRLLGRVCWGGGEIESPFFFANPVFHVVILIIFTNIASMTQGFT